jgi:hypothetical protein
MLDRKGVTQSNVCDFQTAPITRRFQKIILQVTAMSIAVIRDSALISANDWNISVGLVCDPKGAITTWLFTQSIFFISRHKP